MQEVLAHAMAAQQREVHHGQASHHSTDDEPHPAPVSTVQAEYAACESVQKESCTEATVRHRGVLNARHAAFQRVCTRRRCHDTG